MRTVLNLYSGLGGNRKLWSDVSVVAVERDPEIAELYSRHFPEDEVIVGDAHEYLERNWDRFDFIWASPPCQSHSKVRMMASKAGSYAAVMPSMDLWAEIIFLKHFRGARPWAVENVKPYYEPLVPPTAQIGRHLFWCNFKLESDLEKDGLTHNQRGTSYLGAFDLRGVKTEGRKDQMIRNCVVPEIGKKVYDAAFSGKDGKP